MLLNLRCACCLISGQLPLLLLQNWRHAMVVVMLCLVLLLLLPNSVAIQGAYFHRQKPPPQR